LCVTSAHVSGAPQQSSGAHTPICFGIVHENGNCIFSPGESPRSLTPVRRPVGDRTGMRPGLFSCLQAPQSPEPPQMGPLASLFDSPALLSPGRWTPPPPGRGGGFVKQGPGCGPGTGCVARAAASTSNGSDLAPWRGGGAVGSTARLPLPPTSIDSPFSHMIAPLCYHAGGHHLLFVQFIACQRRKPFEIIIVILIHISGHIFFRILAPQLRHLPPKNLAKWYDGFPPCTPSSHPPQCRVVQRAV